ncbi:MAG: PqqD family protein [Planctomycetes bacterium]|nr:PqqD family protein [Planctomycetota bacterium]
MKPLRKQGFFMQNAGCEAILHNSGKKVIHVLNPTAKLVWKLCDGNHTPEDIEKAIRTNFSITDKHDVSGDILKILEAFYSKGILAMHHYNAGS